MVLLNQIIEVLEQVAPRPLQENYDNSGLLTGHPTMEIKAALLALDCTEDIVAEAVAKGCNLVLVHHPIIFKGLKSLTGKNYVERTVLAAIRQNIAIYACHTNLDNVLQNGVNLKIAEKLNLSGCRILDPKDGTLCKLSVFVPNDYLSLVSDALYVSGAGHIGNYSHCGFEAAGTGTFQAGQGANPFAGKIGEAHREAETRLETVVPTHLLPSVLRAMKSAHPYEEVAYDVYPLQNSNPQIGAGLLGELSSPMEITPFLEMLKSAFGLQILRYTQFKETRPIQTVAICGGSGSFLIQKARNSGADAYITGDVKYHEFFDAEGQMMICDIGHWESEQFTTEIFHSLLKKNFPNFAAIFAETKTNPVNYYF